MPAPAQAILFMVGSSLFVAGTTLLAKSLGTGHFGTVEIGQALHPFQVTFGRFFFAWLLVCVVVAAVRPRFTRPAWPLHVARTLCGLSGVTLLFAAAAVIPLADATAISFLNPIFAMLLAIPLLGERVGKWRWIAAAISLIGAFVLMRPGADGLQIGTLLALGAAAILGLEAIFIKRLSGGEAPLQILIISNSIGLGMISLLVIPVWQAPSPAQWLCLAGLGFLMASAQFCFVNAVSREDASFVTPFFYLTLVFAAIFDLAIFGVLPERMSFLGIGFILVGAAVLAWRGTRSPKNALG
ncbi:MAG: DMT family transporter [Pseudomonadota bacterium]